MALMARTVRFTSSSSPEILISEPRVTMLMRKVLSSSRMFSSKLPKRLTVCSNLSICTDSSYKAKRLLSQMGGKMMKSVKNLKDTLT